MEQLIRELMLWAVILTGYPSPDELPVIEAVPHKQLSAKICQQSECPVTAYFDTHTQVIYIDERLDLKRDDYARGFALHEIVHYLQFMDDGSHPDQLDCKQRIAKEKEAYKVQQHFLRAHKENTYQVNLALSLIESACTDDKQEMQPLNIH